MHNKRYTNTIRNSLNNEVELHKLVNVYENYKHNIICERKVLCF